MYSFFKKTIKYYIFSGAFLSLLVFATMVLLHYEASLQYTLNDFSRALGNISRIREHMDDMDRVMERIQKLSPGLMTMKSREALLIATDDIKRNIPRAQITLQDMIVEGRELMLPVTIDMTVKRYGALLRAVHYLESLVFPYITVHEMSVQKESRGSVVTGIKTTLQVMLHMPNDEEPAHGPGTLPPPGEAGGPMPGAPGAPPP